MDVIQKSEQNEPAVTIYAAGEALADKHWQYVVDLLRIHVSFWHPELEQLEFHYKSAMIHGYKHGVADRERVFKSEAAEEAVD